MAADPLDAITLPYAKSAVNFNASQFTNDERLGRLIATVSRRLDEVIGPVVNRTVTEYHSGSGGAIWPYQTPVSTVTSLTEYDGSSETILTAETFGTSPDDAYLLEQSGAYAHDHRIVRRSGGSSVMFANGRRNIELVYVAGRAVDTDSVDSRISETAGMILNDIWKREAPKWSQTADLLATSEPDLPMTGVANAVMRRVKELLHDEMKPPGMA